MLIFGLTGGIASGKSTVSHVLEELGCAVIDTDLLARRGSYTVHTRFAINSGEYAHAYEP